MGSEFYTHYAGVRNDVYVRFVDSDGNRRQRVVKNGSWKPTLFVDANPSNSIDAKTIHGSPLTKYRCDSISHGRKVLKDFEEQGQRVHGYGKWSNMLMAERYNPEEISEAWDESKISTMFIDIETEAEHGFPSPKDPKERVNMVTMVDTLTEKIVVLGLEGEWRYDPNGPLSEIMDHLGMTPDQIIWESHDTEENLLASLINWFGSIAPDVVTGWNLEKFDIPYIINRIKVLRPGDGERIVNRLSPWGIVNSRMVQSRFGEDEVFDIVGVSILDMMVLYKKFVLAPRESYKLDHIVHVDLGERKLKHETGIPGHLLYREHFSDGVDYNIKDVLLLIALDRKRNILRSTMTIAYTSLVNFTDVTSQIRMWDNMIYCDLRRRGIELPCKIDHRPGVTYPGAYVKPPIVGRHYWVVSFDVTSMYPSLIRALNISPEKLLASRTFRLATGTVEEQCAAVDWYLDEKVGLGEAVAESIAVGANGHCFDAVGIGLLPRIVKRLFDERKMYKNKMIDCKKAAEASDDPSEKKKLKDEAGRWDLLQNARKVQLNSLYGAMGNEYFRFYDVRMATAITLTGQLLIKWVARDLNKFMRKFTKKERDYVITIDTDGIYVNFDELVEDQMPGWERDRVVEALVQFCESVVEPMIAKSLKRLSEYLNCFEPEALHMKREAVADAGVFVAKKKYFLNVMDDEGVRFTADERGVGKLKVMGVEAKKSSTPAVLRDWMENCFPLFLFGTEKDFQADVENCRKMHEEIGVQAMAFNTSIGKVSEYTGPDSRPVKGAPMNSRAAITYNRAIRDANLIGIHRPIVEGDKMKFVLLKMPNKFGSNVIGWIDDMPEEIGIQDAVDIAGMFQKTFVAPMKTIANAVGWEPVYRPRLDEWF